LEEEDLAFSTNLIKLDMDVIRNMLGTKLMNEVDNKQFDLWSKRKKAREEKNRLRNEKHRDKHKNEPYEFPDWSFETMEYISKARHSERKGEFRRPKRHFMFHESKSADSDEEINPDESSSATENEEEMLDNLALDRIYAEIEWLTHILLRREIPREEDVERLMELTDLYNRYQKCFSHEATVAEDLYLGNYHRWMPEDDTKPIENIGEFFKYLFSKKFLGDVMDEFNKLIEYLKDVYDVWHDIVPYTNEIIGFLYEVLVFVYRMFQSTTVTNIMISFFSFMKNCGIPISYWKSFADDFKNVVLNIPSYNSDKEFMTEGLYEDAADMFAKINKALDCKLFETIKNMLIAAASWKVFPYQMSSKVFKCFGFKKNVSILEGFGDMMKMMLAVIRSGDLVRSGVPLSEAIFCDDPAHKLLSDINDLLARKDSLFTGLPTRELAMVGMDRIAFAEKSDECIRLADLLIPRLEKHEPNKKKLKEANAKLKETMIGVLNFIHSTRRVVPFAFRVHGYPGSGKSMWIPLVYALVCEYFGWTYDPAMVYTRVPSSQYFDGVIPLSHKFIKYNEVGTLHKNIASKQGDPIVSELTAMIDCAQFPLDMSDVKDKGKNFALFVAVGMDCNDKNMNLEESINNPAAVQRRIADIHIQPTPAFTKPGTNAIDPEKSLASDLPLMDKYQVSITTFDAIDNGQTLPCQVGKPGMTTHEACDLLRELIKKHFDRQNRILELPDTYLPSYMYTRENVGLTATEIKLKYAALVSAMTPELEKGLYGITGLKPVDDLFSESDSKEDSPFDYSSSEYVDIETLIGNAGHPLQTESLVEDEFDSDLEVIYGWRIFSNWWANFDLDDLPDFTIVRLVWYVFLLNLSIVSIALLRGGVRQLPEMMRRANRFLKLTRWFLIAVEMLIFVWFDRTLVSMSGVLIIALLLWYLPQDMKEVVDDALKTLKENLYRELLGYQMRLSLRFSRAKDEVTSLFPLWYRNNAKLINGAVALLVVGKIVYNYVKKEDPKPHIVTEATDFKVDTKLNSTLNAFEDSFDCGKSYKRVMMKTDMPWSNLMHVLTPGHTGGFDSLYKSLGKNIRACLVHTLPFKPMRTYILGLEGNVAVINKHVFRGTIAGSSVGVCLTGGFKDDKPSITHDTVLTERDYVYVSDDVVLVRLNLPSAFSNIVKHVADDSKFPTHSAGMIAGDAVRVTYSPRNFALGNKFGPDTILDQSLSYLWSKHKPGMCGLPLLTEMGNKQCISGIHSAGSTTADFKDVCIAAVVTRAMLEPAILELAGKSNFMRLASEGAIHVPLEEPNAKSPFRYEELHKLEYYGKTAEKVNINNVSKLITIDCEAEIRKALNDVGLHPEKVFLPPVMKPKVTKHGYISPYNLALNKMAEKNVPLNRNILERIIDELTKRLCDAFKVEKLQPYDMETAINGVLEDEYFRRMNVATSNGYGWRGVKSDLLGIVEESPGILIREPNLELKETLVKAFAIMAEGNMVRFVIKAALKDEPREKHKVDKGDTRVFYVSPTEYILISRMLLGPFFSHLVQFGKDIGCCVGINIVTGADELVKRMQAFCSIHADGDWKKFDVKIPQEVTWAAISVVERVLRCKGYNEAALQCVRSVLSERMFPLIYMVGDLFVAPGLTTSGDLGTAELNCLKETIITMYLYYLNPKLWHTDFFDFVYKPNYGDDGILNVKEEIRHLFNNKIFAELASKHLGMEYTSASKTGEVQESMEMSELSFLKRNFVYKEEFSRWVACIDPNSILKCLTMFIKSKVVTFEQQVESSFISAQLELFLHLEEEEFMRVCKSLEDIFSSKFYGKAGLWSFPKSREQLIADLQF